MPARTAFVYFIAIFSIIGWWYAAFVFHSTPHPIEKKTVESHAKRDSRLDSLSLLNREDLKKALSGDYALMGKLIADWDVDAQILEAQGFSGILRLSPGSFLKSQMLSREIASGPRQNTQCRFLPQTYAAACFLLAFVDAKQIVALPNGLRKETSLYPCSLMDQIPLDIDRYNSEKLFLARPDIAFVSTHYSHPSAIQALQNQGIKIHDTGQLSTLANIQKSLQSIGEAVSRKKEASLLNLFIQASLHAIKNRLLLQKQGKGLLAAKILYLNYHDKFYLPSKETFISEILSRLEIAHYPFRRGSVPIEKENLFVLDPDCLIISSSHGESLKRQIEADPELKNLTAVKQGRVFFVDDSIQQSPTQFAVLAYYDLAEAITQAKLP